MQREIKFRAWDAVNKMMDCNVFINGDGSVYDYASPTYNTPNIEIERQDFTIMQYTGIKDMYGIDVFEGDILKLSNVFDNQGYFKKAVVTFEDGAFECNYSLLKRYAKNTFEVIGNVYENPELLEVK